MSQKIAVINGPNLNLLGTRNPEIYGEETLEDIEIALAARAKDLGLEVFSFQSNGEGRLIDAVQQSGKDASGIIINAGGYSHTSIALRDALEASEVPVIEVHLSNIFAREEFRQHSFISEVAAGVICGLGKQGYLCALDAMSGLISKD